MASSFVRAGFIGVSRDRGARTCDLSRRVNTEH